MSITTDVELPSDLARLRLPKAVASRLQRLLDRQDAGETLTDEERAEAEGLVELADLLTLLRLGRTSPIVAGDDPPMLLETL